MKKPLIIITLLLICAQPGVAGTIQLKRAWIEKYKDRATIDVTFTVDHAHKSPNKPEKDADMHVAGRAPKEVGLPMVAEMMNAFYATAGAEKDAIAAIHAREQDGQTAGISGAWRLWFEHPAASQTQFATVPKAGNTNPDHSFEIHPITKFDGHDVGSTFRMIENFQGYSAEEAFSSYEKLTIAINSTASGVTLEAKKTGHNYTHFRMHLLAKPKKLQDAGYAVLADVTDEKEAEDDEPIAAKVRMIFVPGTPPWEKIHKDLQNIDDGTEFDALGIPRLNLNAIWTAIKASPKMSGKLPYEIIVVGLK
jgi:hypothetical protein